MSLRRSPRLLRNASPLASVSLMISGHTAAQGLAPEPIVAACSVAGQPVIVREPTELQTSWRVLVRVGAGGSCSGSGCGSAQGLSAPVVSLCR